jgi:hypothetical protein
MSVREYVNTSMVMMVLSKIYSAFTKPTMEKMEEAYNNYLPCLPRVYAKDGFNISIQCRNGNYCDSENGTRTFGFDWKLVEWGFPSEPIDGKKYNAEDEENTTDTVGGYVPMEDIESLIEEHGGFDLETTLKMSVSVE